MIKGISLAVFLPRQRRCSASQAQRGIVMVELLVALGVGLLIIASLCNLLMASQRSYALVDDSARLDDNAIYTVGNDRACLPCGHNRQS